MTIHPSCGRRLAVRGGFTLIEILIVVVILGILAAIVVPKFTSAAEETNESSVRRTLQIVRHQIELYRAKERTDPDLIGSQWADLLMNDYLHATPVNAFNKSITIGGAAAIGVGWVWRDPGNGTFGFYATDENWAEFVE